MSDLEMYATMEEEEEEEDKGKDKRPTTNPLYPTRAQKLLVVASLFCWVAASLDVIVGILDITIYLHYPELLVARECAIYVLIVGCGMQFLTLLSLFAGARSKSPNILAMGELVSIVLLLLDVFNLVAIFVRNDSKKVIELLIPNIISAIICLASLIFLIIALSLNHLDDFHRLFNLLRSEKKFKMGAVSIEQNANRNE